jgi:hypothetical protein
MYIERAKNHLSKSPSQEVRKNNKLNPKKDKRKPKFLSRDICEHSFYLRGTSQ